MRSWTRKVFSWLSVPLDGSGNQGWAESDIKRTLERVSFEQVHHSLFRSITVITNREEFLANRKSTHFHSPVDELLPLPMGAVYADSLYCNLTDNTFWYASRFQMAYSDYTPPAPSSAKVSIHVLRQQVKESIPVLDSVVVVLMRHYTNIFHFAESANSLLRYLHASYLPVVSAANCCVTISRSTSSSPTTRARRSTQSGGGTTPRSSSIRFPGTTIQRSFPPT